DIEERLVYGTDVYDSNSDNDALSDGTEVAWGYDPLNANSPIVASSLINSATVVGFSVTAYVNHYTAMDYVKFYARYQNSIGQWTGFYYIGIDYTPSSGKYSKYWTVSSAYVRMELKVYAYNSGSVNLGYDTQYFKLNGGGGPPIE
ncbi:MAG: thrombospondin type 3 repeat-containing protein, partial [Candidatus Thorarchaeota archaeon]|nr:thrombospondin type 3 repeat-containing protein [Candidatus Thorarchaeota archaeon]